MNNPFTPLLAFLLFCQTLAAQTDTIAPYLRCKTIVATDIGPNCYRTFWAADLIDSLSDNAPGTVSTRVRKRCTGTGYPESSTSISYNANDLYENQVAEVWAQDASGNTSSCEVKIFISNLMGNCDPMYTIIVDRPDGAGIAGVTFTLTGQNCLGDTIPASRAQGLLTNTSGLWGQYSGLVEPGFASTLRPAKTSNPSNGVTTSDLVAIQRHINGLEPFDAPWKHLAADANLDGKVTLQDVVLLQKLILGLVPDFPHGQSWRFYPKNHVFQDPANPLQPVPPQAIVVPASAEQAPILFQFTGVKIGDLNGNADPKL